MVHEVLGVGPGPEYPADLSLGHAPAKPQNLLDIAVILLRVGPVERGGEHPVTRERGIGSLVADPLVFIDADEVREVECQITSVAGYATPGQASLQETDPERGPLQRTEGHANEKYLGHRGPPSTFMAERPQPLQV